MAASKKSVGKRNIANQGAEILAAVEEVGAIASQLRELSERASVLMRRAVRTAARLEQLRRQSFGGKQGDTTRKGRG